MMTPTNIMKTTTTLLKATIISGNPEDAGARIEIRCRRDSDGEFRWYGPDGADTSVSARTIQEAKDIAELAWAGSAWSLRARWL